MWLIWSYISSLFLQVWNLTHVASVTDPSRRDVRWSLIVAKSTIWTSTTLTNSAEIKSTSARSAAIQRLMQANTFCISEKTIQTTPRLWSVTTDDSSNLMAGKQQRNKMSTCRGRDRRKKDLLFRHVVTLPTCLPSEKHLIYIECHDCHFFLSSHMREICTVLVCKVLNAWSRNYKRVVACFMFCSH